MIPFEDLVRALERFKRRQAGEQEPAAPPVEQAPREARKYTDEEFAVDDLDIE